MIQSHSLLSRVLLAVFAVLMGFQSSAMARDLREIRESGVLRHLGIPYANFVTGSGDGLDVELIQKFAQYLGVRYDYVKTNWQDSFGDLIGRKVKPRGNKVEILQATPVRGDLLASGVTILPWRQSVAAFSTPTFPTGVWLIAHAECALQPIVPQGDIAKDIAAVRSLLAGHSILCLRHTCLDPDLYALEETGAKVKFLARIRNLNEMVPAVLNREAEATLLDVPDALIALEKWPGQIKVIGPLTPLQEMGVVFPKDAPKLRQAFNDFFRRITTDGIYLRLVKKYYPSVLRYYEDYFTAQAASVH